MHLTGDWNIAQHVRDMDIMVEALLVNVPTQTSSLPMLYALAVDDDGELTIFGGMVGAVKDNNLAQVFPTALRLFKVARLAQATGDHIPLATHDKDQQVAGHIMSRMVGMALLNFSDVMVAHTQQAEALGVQFPNKVSELSSELLERVDLMAEEHDTAFKRIPCLSLVFWLNGIGGTFYRQATITDKAVVVESEVRVMTLRQRGNKEGYFLGQKHADMSRLSSVEVIFDEAYDEALSWEINPHDV